MSAVMYTYVDGMMDKRSPYRSDHLALLTAMTEEGTCLLGEVPLIRALFHAHHAQSVGVLCWYALDRW